jgi:hypothetical protein
MDRVFHPPNAPSLDIVAGLVSTFENLKLLATILKHLRHKWQALQAAEFIQARQDFFFAADFNPLPGFEVQGSRAVYVMPVHQIPSLPLRQAASDSILESPPVGTKL